jgi:hypothetical protein
MRRAALIFAALILAFPVASCGGGDEDNTAPENVTTTGEGGGTEGTTTGETTTETGGETETEGTTSGEGQGGAAAGKEVFASAGCGSCQTSTTRSRPKTRSSRGSRTARA